MKNLNIETMVAIEGGGCPWWAGGLVDTVFTAAGLCCVSAPTCSSNSCRGWICGRASG